MSSDGVVHVSRAVVVGIVAAATVVVSRRPRRRPLRRRAADPADSWIAAPFWRGSPAVVRLTGHLPGPEARVTALRAVRTAAASVREDVVMHDRTAA